MRSGSALAGSSAEKDHAKIAKRRQDREALSIYRTLKSLEFLRDLSVRFQDACLASFAFFALFA
jgi:hypothetical protein